MNIHSARAALRNPPRMTWLLMLVETAVTLAASLALVGFLAR